MKNYLYILLIALFLGSCSRELNVYLDQSEQLILNGKLDAGCAENLIYVSLSTGNKIGHISQAEVTLYINGQQAETLKDVTDEQTFIQVKEDSIMGFNGEWLYPDAKVELSRTRIYASTHPLRAGDVAELRVSAEQGRLKAQAQVVIPEKPELIGSSIEYLDKTHYTVNLRDLSSDLNFYRIEVRHKDLVKATFYGWDYKEQGDSVYWVNCIPRLETQRDLIFNDGGVSEEIAVPGLKPSINNQYAVFSNQLFRGREREICVETTPNSCVRRRDYPGDGSGYRDYTTLQTKSEIRLYTISSLSYNYYKCLNLWDSDDYEDAVMDPIIFPCNVTGGLGFIDACHSVSYPFDDHIFEYE